MKPVWRWALAVWLLVTTMLMAPPLQAQAERPTGQAIELVGDGVSLPGLLYRPSAPGPSPAVVLSPGGVAQGVPEGLDWLASRLAAAGYVVLTVSYRAAFPADDPRDIGLALDWLERDPGVDRSRLAIAGHSRGGMSTLRTAASEPRARAVVAYAAPTDLAQNVRGTVLFAPGRHETLAAWMGGNPEEARERYELVQAISYADRIRQPVLLVHGTSDLVAPPELSIWMERALRRAGNDRVRLELLPGLGHFWEQGFNGYQFDRVASLTLEWLAETLGAP